MSHGDVILIDTLKKLWRKSSERDQDDGPSSLADFSVDFVLTSCCLLLNAIATAARGSTDDDRGKVLHEVAESPLPTDSPPSMAARYNLGSRLADLCAQLGYGDSPGFGYQTFLHGNEAELRQLFLFLVDKLPAGAPGKGGDAAAGGGVEAECVADEDPFCSCPICLSDLSADEAVRLLPRESRNAAFNLFSKGNNSIANISRNDRKGDVATVVKRLENENSGRGEDTTPVVNDENGSSEPSPAEKEKLELLRNLKEEKARKERRLHEQRQRQKALRDEITALRSEGKELAEAASITTRENASLRADLERRSKLVGLMGEEAETAERLRARAAKSEEKMAALRSEWERARSQLEAEKEELLLQLAQKPSAVSDREEVLADVRERIAEAEAHLAQKEAAVKSHSAAAAKMADLGAAAGGERESYTRRILDILASIRAQREETDRVIANIQQTQRDINLLEGKLGRTYSEVSYRVFEAARQEPLLVPAYRHVGNLHLMCADIVETLRAIGRTKRAVRDARDAVEGEKLRKSGEKLEAIKRDLEALRAENKMLKDELKLRQEQH